MTARPELLDGLQAELVREFGGVALRSEPYPFEISDYYEQELGSPIRRTWFCFGELCRPEALPDFRRTTGVIERRFAIDSRRRVNLDPGYMDHGKLVLASVKEAPDKIYMGGGVWAHTCVRYRFGSFSAPDHSFPDFKDGRYDRFLEQARRLYKTLRREC